LPATLPGGGHVSMRREALQWGSSRTTLYCASSHKPLWYFLNVTEVGRSLALSWGSVWAVLLVYTKARLPRVSGLAACQLLNASQHLSSQSIVSCHFTETEGGNWPTGSSLLGNILQMEILPPIIKLQKSTQGITSVGFSPVILRDRYIRFNDW
jgi:hypothetical protein